MTRRRIPRDAKAVADHEARRVRRVPQPRDRLTAAAREIEKRFAEIAKDVVSVDRASEGAVEETLDGARRVRRQARRHDVSSFDSSPSHSPSSTRRDSRSARIPAAVTVK